MDFPASPVSQGSSGQQGKLDHGKEVEDGSEEGIGPGHPIVTQIETAAHLL